MKNNHMLYIDAAKPCELEFERLGRSVDDYGVAVRMAYGGLTLERKIYLKDEALDSNRDLFIEAVYEMRNNLLKGVAI